MHRRRILSSLALGVGSSLISMSSKVGSVMKQPITRHCSVAIYGTESLANNEGYRPIAIAQSELQYVLNNSFADRQGWRDEGYNVADVEFDVSAYGWGSSHDFSVNMKTQSPFDALSDFRSKVQSDEIPYTGDINLLLTNHSGSGLAGSTCCVAGANSMVDNEIGDMTVRESEGDVVHIEEILHCLGFSENHGVVRELDYNEDGTVDRQVVTPLWGGGIDETKYNQCGNKQPTIDYAGDAQLKYDMSPSDCVERASPRIPGKGWGQRGPWWKYQPGSE